MSVEASSLLQGTLIGGSLGAFIAWGLMSKWSQVAENEDKALADSLALLHAHRQLCSDSILYVALQEPLRVFQQCDSAGAQGLLQSLNRLVSLFQELSAGSTAPEAIPRILKEKREASNRLHALLRKAWRAQPFAASEIEQDIQCIKKSIDGYVHNSMQQSTLNLLKL